MERQTTKYIIFYNNFIYHHIHNRFLIFKAFVLGTPNNQYYNRSNIHNNNL